MRSIPKTAFLILAVLLVVAARSLPNPVKSASAYSFTSYNYYLADIQGNNYGYHQLSVYWLAWNGSQTAVSTMYQTTMVSPSSGYYYDSWYGESTWGPTVVGGSVTTSDWGNLWIDYYTNNPNYRSKDWGYGVNDQEVVASVCPSGWCNSSALWDWGAYIVEKIPRYSISAYVDSAAH